MYVSQKGFNSKRDFQGHSMTLVLLPLHRFRDIMIYFPKRKESRDLKHIPFDSDLSYFSLSISIPNLKCLDSPAPKRWWGP